MNRPYLSEEHREVVAVSSQPTLHPDLAPDLELEPGVAALRGVEVFCHFLVQGGSRYHGTAGQAWCSA